MLTRRNRLVLIDNRAGGARRLPQSRNELAVVNLMILRTVHRASERRGKMRLASARFRRIDPFDREFEFLLERELMHEARAVIGRDGEDQRPFVA